MLGLTMPIASGTFFCLKSRNKMKYLLIFLSFITTIHADPTWTMIKCNAPLSYSVDFDCLEGDVSTDKIVRSGLFTPRYYYELYSSEGTFSARAVNRVLSFGLLAPSQMEFDIYDETDAFIGYIGGKFWTNGKAKFEFTDANGLNVGSALLSSDSDQAIFSILSPNNKILATLKGTLSGDLSKWEFEVNQPLDIDPRTLKIFTAFVSDFHVSFIRKPIVIHNHYNNNYNSNR
jgi:hypothetical protein